MAIGYKTIISLFFVWFVPAIAGASEQTSQGLHFSGKEFELYQTLNPAALLISDSKGGLLYADNIEQPLVPASTTKLITALLALNHWGVDFRFYTDFAILQPNACQDPCHAAVLRITPFGDPFLVSEELQLIAEELSKRLKIHNIHEISQIQIVNHWYQPNIKLPGHSDSLNPYDAVNSEFAVNFNSLNALRTKAGWQSAEEQTPWTSSANKIVKASGLKLAVGKQERINIGGNESLNQQYAVEVLQVFLKQQGIKTQNTKLLSASQEESEKPLLSYRHFNSRTLAEMVKPMMKYSTNFIANQIALNLSAEIYGAPASPEKLQRLYKEGLQRIFGWQDKVVHFEDGAGLSRDNQISAEQLMEVLIQFEPWKKLLPEVEQGVYAKSGSLIGVSTLAGYLHHKEQWLPFVFLSNQRVPYHFRNRLAKSLRAQLPNHVEISQ